jgi:CubicO group peptidase (beta-lactamase class C family)
MWASRTLAASVACLLVGTGLSADPAPSATGKAGAGLEHFDAMMQETLDHYHVPGGALAIAKDGRLVLARGYGWADVEARAPVRPMMLFGIASVSKSITAVTALKMVDDGKLKLDEPVLKLLGPLQPPPGTKEDPRWRRITVRMLLNHSGGWDADKSGDSTGWSERVAKDLHVAEPIDRRQLIRYMLGQPLDFDPGTESHYSNFGFALLGAVIEHVGGETYGEYVHRHTLIPMGIQQARLPDREKDFARDEVHRYPASKTTPLPPAHPAVGDPAGGWKVSVVDLATFLCAVDGSRGKRFLSDEMTKDMLTTPKPPLKVRPAGGYFGLGWDTVLPGTTGFSYSKNGGLPGIRSFIGHIDSGVNWAVVFNGDETRPKGEPDLDTYAIRHVRRMVAETKAWPDNDFFKFFKPDSGPAKKVDRDR